MFGLPNALARPLARRISMINAITDFAAHRHGTVHLDAANLPDTYHPSMWSVDRLHPSERGHRLLAASYADLLETHGLAPYRRPDMQPTNPPPTRRAQMLWMATRGTRWLRDRCTDLLPSLMWMAAAESWYELRGQARRVDERINQELAYALAHLAQLEAAPGSGTTVTPT
jgi:hypothetical protein